MKALILAGGFATRLWPLTEQRAKPLLILNGKTILAHLLDKIPETMETILLTNKKFEQHFQEELHRLKRRNVEIFCEDAHAEGEKLGALRAVSVAIQHYHINESIIILAGDNLLPELNIEQLFCSEKEASIAVQDVGDTFEARKFGVIEINPNDPDSVIGFEEKPTSPRSTLVSTGCTSIGKDLFPKLHDLSQRSPDRLGDIFSHLLEHQTPIRAIQVPGAWFDVGSFDTYLAAHRQLQTPAIQIHPTAKVSLNQCSGKVFIGPGCVVKNCKIRDSILYENCILENCSLSSVIIDENCDLEGLDLNHKLIRRQTKLKSKHA